MHVIEEPDDDKSPSVEPRDSTRPSWVAPELVKLKIWSDTLGSNIALVGDHALTRVTPAS
jgi:hypothetical protein